MKFKKNDRNLVTILSLEKKLLIALFITVFC